LNRQTEGDWPYLWIAAAQRQDAGGRSHVSVAAVVARGVNTDAMMLGENDEWSLNWRYMRLEGLHTLSDTVPTRLSAVAR
jgi:hypothetical protein